MVRFSGKSFRLGEKIRRAQAYTKRVSAANLAHTQLASPTWRETPSTSSVSAQETRYPHEMDTGKKSLATRDSALLEVLDAALNQGLELVASSELRNVLVEACTGALRVTHLAQDAAIGAGNALDS